MILLQSGDLLQLFKETETIQKGLKDSTKPKSIAQLSKKFVEHMNTDRINSAIKLLSNNLEKWRIASEQRGLNKKELQLNF